MLLSIVECSDYRQSADWQAQTLIGRPVGHHCERIEGVKGPSVAIMRNRGAKAAKGRWIFFKDSDCEIDIPKLNEICEKLEQNQSPFKILGGVYQPRTQDFVGEIYSFIQRNWVISGLQTKRTQGLRHAHKLLGGALLVEKKTFELLGGFSEAVGWGAEEMELTQRARALAIPIAVSYRLKVVHHTKMNLGAFVKRAWFQNFNPGFFSFKREASIRTGFSYFNSPMRYWPSLVLFFSVGTIANSSGVLARKWGGLWK